MNESQLSLDQIWRLGCLGEKLSMHDRKRFEDVVRSRFHTFSMSATHARESKTAEDAASWIDLLVQSLAKELLANPGLEREWHGSDYAASLDGSRVTQVLSQKT